MPINYLGTIGLLGLRRRRRHRHPQRMGQLHLRRRAPLTVAVVSLFLAGCSLGGNQPAEHPSGEVDPDELARALEVLADSAPPAMALLPEGTRANHLLGGCLVGLGVDVTYAGAGGIHYRSSGDIADAAADAEAACEAALDQLGWVAYDVTPELSRDRYHAYLDAYGCLLGLGENPPPPPTEDEFVAGTAWSPFEEIPTKVDAAGTLSGPAVTCAVP